MSLIPPATVVAPVRSGLVLAVASRRWRGRVRHEDGQDARRDRDRGDSEGPPVAAGVDQPHRGDDGQDGQQFDHVEEEGGAGGGWPVVHCASAAAIFIGWYLPSTTPSSSPISSVNKIAGISTISAIRADWVNTRPVPAVPQPRGHRQHDDGSGGQRREQHPRASPDEHWISEPRPDVGSAAACR